jgi:hypothetical protein
VNLLDSINAANRRFLRRYPRIAWELVQDAVERESPELRADAATRMLVSVGEREAERPDQSGVIATCYNDRDDAPVINLFQFLNEVYRKAVRRFEAFDYRDQDELDELEKGLEDAKRERLGNLSQSTVTHFEDILAHEADALQARSDREIEKRSFTRIRRVQQQQAEAARKLQALGAKRNVDAEAIHQALEQMRLRLDAHQRRRQTTLEKGQRRIMEFWDDFLEAIRDPLEGLATMGYLALPDAQDVEDLPVSDWQSLHDTVYLILAADETIVPQAGEHNRPTDWPMPRVVLVPASGYVRAGTTLATEAFGENAIFFPIRCLEDPVHGLARELLRLKRKMNPRAVRLATEEFSSYLGSDDILESRYEQMYERFLRFCLGDEESSASLDATQKQTLREHFLPRYTRDLFVPPDLRPLLRQLPAGSPEARARFNHLVMTRKEDLFHTAVLYADRVDKYDALLRELRAGPTPDPAGEERALRSRASNLAAAKRLFQRAYKEGNHPRFALYNTGLLLRAEAQTAPEPQDRNALRTKAAHLLEKSIEDAPLDLWSFKAAALVKRCRRPEALEGGQVDEPSREGSAPTGAEESGLFEWVMGKMGRRG